MAQAQTPKQRMANAKYAKREEQKRAKPEAAVKTQKQSFKSPISAGWVVLLAFVVCGGVFFELLRVVPHLYQTVMSFFGQ
ncbi:hypothetical protein FQN54_000651 [Arachnomyces sp. PD_36]|nr:hypothetical protein FQN54_000651 [Arachnomyces sp. PD_36]